MLPKPGGHLAIATIACGDVAQAEAALRQVAGHADAAEIRLDALWPEVPDSDRATDDLLRLLDAAPVPLVATLRPRRHGGRFNGPENVRVGLLQAALQAGFAAADAEADVLTAPGVASTLRTHGDLVPSIHTVGEQPCRSDGLQFLQQLQDSNGRLDKLALNVGAFNEGLRVLELCRAHAERGGHPALAPIGHDAVALRALLPFTGNRATYGAAAGSPPAVAGQPTLAKVQATWAHWGLGAADLDHLVAQPRKWLAVLGHPVGHSLSPALHNAALRAGKRAERYAALDVPASVSALRLALHVLPRLGCAGVSVTAPHKADAARIAKGDAGVQATGAANCIRWNGEQAEATNTDLSALTRLTAGLSAGSDALILGAGGAARAAVHALLANKARVTVAARDPAKAKWAETAGASLVPWDRRADRAFAAVIQATPLGMDAADPSPLPATALRPGALVVELVYGAGPTRLQQDAQRAGCKVVDGRTVLLEQALDAYRFWTGQAPDRRAIESALPKVGA